MSGEKNGMIHFSTLRYHYYSWWRKKDPNFFFWKKVRTPRVRFIKMHRFFFSHGCTLFIFIFTLRIVTPSTCHSYNTQVSFGHISSDRHLEVSAQCFFHQSPNLPFSNPHPPPTKFAALSPSLSTHLPTSLTPYLQTKQKYILHHWASPLRNRT